MFNSEVLEVRGIQYAPPATDKNDIAGENGIDAKEYDTDLNYTGAITFCNEETNSTYWCYFIQIKEVAKKDKLTIDF